MASYRLTDIASSEIEDIFVFGLMTFGFDQAAAYQLKLSHVFQLLADNPAMGRRADPLNAAMRRHEHGSHRIFYEPSTDGVLIVSVIHMSSVRRPGDPA
ncbi:type II toxin-antitoxin system RelE/ParE family toxin [Devosia sp.]|uniref:type II toxin-antitoxin system RelE/ParE family toxin n=1 Tax=Devosia sp. TaxID=1871048 RepID=UPI003267DDF4